ncbi:hypothetical protein [Rubritalea tangerina]|uniref:3-keto-disaccharide hydrolase domain-containing protein n=1 Tax=Rubritalea tangerina TaxID=430798 RepID=A0ABW4Z9C5_9BACT
MFFKHAVTLLSWAALLSVPVLADASVRSWQWSGDGDELTMYRANGSVTWELSEGSLLLDNSKKSLVAGKVRRPGGFVLAPGKWGDVTFSVDGRSLASEVTVNRDVCLIFGYQDETHFYYAHLSRNSDGKYHTVLMRVDGDSRTVIHEAIEIGVDKGPLVSSKENKRWQNFRVTHRKDGRIAVYVDDMQVPVLKAKDVTYPVGRLGCGTFDDPAMFKNLRVSGTRLDG